MKRFYLMFHVFYSAVFLYAVHKRRGAFLGFLLNSYFSSLVTCCLSVRLSVNVFTFYTSSLEQLGKIVT